MTEAEIDYGDKTGKDISSTAAHKRKHSRVDSGVSGSLLSNKSGHRSDGSESNEEEDIVEDAFSHSPKRRRSNDWPLPDGANSPPRSVNKREGRSSRRRQEHSATRKRGESRFIEGSMHDRVSERPPSAYIGDVEDDEKYVAEEIEEAEQGRLKKKSRGHHRGNNSISSTVTNNSANSKQSGIFRFGKAIASIFNPGMWGSGSGADDGKDNPSVAERADKEALKLAGEKAYAELKKSGFKGTSKGESSHARSESSGQESYHSAPDNDVYKTPKGRMGFGSTISLREGLSAFSKNSHKDTKTPAKSPAEAEPVTSIRTSFTDLRKSTTFSRPSSRNGGDSPAPARKSQMEGQTPDRRHVRKEPSRKDLKKVKKLTKHVSDLEEQIEKVKRELRDLTGNDDFRQSSHKPPPLSIENRWKNKFHPGTLPTLPSERILHRREASEVSESEPSASLPFASKSPRKERVIAPTDDEDEDAEDISYQPEEHPKPGRHSKDSIRSNTVIEVPSSRKRKPSAVEPDAELDPRPVDESDMHGNDFPPMSEIIAPSRRTQPSRQAKLQKTVKLDSPGSAERKKKQREKLRSLASDPAILPNNRAPSRVPYPINDGPHRKSLRRQRSSPTNRRSNLKPNQNPNPDPSPMLKAKKSTVDLRSGMSNSTDEQDLASPSPEKSVKRNDENSTRSMQHSKQPKAKNIEEEPSISPTKVPRKKRTAETRYQAEDYIPPVPPVPKSLRATTSQDAKGNRSRLRTAESTTSMGHRASTSITTVPEDSPVKSFQEQVTPRRDEGRVVEGKYVWPEDIF